MVGRSDGRLLLAPLSLGALALSGVLAAALAWTYHGLLGRRKLLAKIQEEDDEVETLNSAVERQQYSDPRREEEEALSCAASSIASSAPCHPIAPGVAAVAAKSCGSLAQAAQGPRDTATSSASASVVPASTVGACSWSSSGNWPLAGGTPWAAPQQHLPRTVGTPWMTTGSTGAAASTRGQATMSASEKRDLDLMFRHQQRQEFGSSGRTLLSPADFSKVRQRTLRRRERGSGASGCGEVRPSMETTTIDCRASLAAEIFTSADTCSAADGGKEAYTDNVAPLESCSLSVEEMEELLVAELCGDGLASPTRAKKSGKKKAKKKKLPMQSFQEAEDSVVTDAEVIAEACLEVGIESGDEAEVEEEAQEVELCVDNHASVEVEDADWVEVSGLVVGERPTTGEEADDADFKEEDVEVAQDSKIAEVNAFEATPSEQKEVREEEGCIGAIVQDKRDIDQGVEEASGSSGGPVLTATTDEGLSRQCSDGEQGDVPLSMTSSLSSGKSDKVLSADTFQRHRAWADFTDTSDDEPLPVGTQRPSPSPVVAAILGCDFAPLPFQRHRIPVSASAYSSSPPALPQEPAKRGGGYRSAAPVGFSGGSRTDLRQGVRQRA